jgi:hypothetical protein
MLPSSESDGRRRSTAVLKFSPNDIASGLTRLEASDTSIFGEATLYTISGGELGGRRLFRNAHRTARLTFVWRIGPCNLLHKHRCFEGTCCTCCLPPLSSKSFQDVRTYFPYILQVERCSWCVMYRGPGCSRSHPLAVADANNENLCQDWPSGAFGALLDTECGVINIWYSDSTDTPARSAVESTVAACSFELDFDRPGKIFALKDNNFKQPNSLAYFYKISTITTRLRSGWSGVRIPGGARLFASSKRPLRLWGPPSLLFNGYRSFFPGILLANAKK